jgi:hypothetical protein
VCGGGRQPELGGVRIDLRWKIDSQVSLTERLFGPNTVVEIKQGAKIEWTRKEKFLG